MITLGASDSLAQADALDWREFERLVQYLFETNGYACRYVGGKRDHGADIIAMKDGRSYAVQVKHRSDGRHWIGERAVQAVVTAAPIYKCERGFVVTNSTFAPGVKSVARIHRVVLRDRTWLKNELMSYCVLCESRVSPRVRKWCIDRPDQYRGNTYCFEHQHHPGTAFRLAEATS